MPNELKTLLVTGVAGFIGSNLLQTRLRLGQRVAGRDSFAAGHQRKLGKVQSVVTPAQWARFDFFKRDIRKLADCHLPCNEVDFVRRQTALGSEPRSLADVSKTMGLLGFEPTHRLAQGVAEAMTWNVKTL